MGERIIAAAQSISIAGDIAANIQRHLCFMQAAMAHRVEFLLFPELSLTGYECARARELAIDPVDARLQPLRDLAHHSGMITVVGASVRLPDSDEVLIAAQCVWSECGALVGATRGGGDQLLIASRDSQGWSTRAMPVVA